MSEQENDRPTTGVAINEDINLVIPVGNGKGWVYCPPLSRTAFSVVWELLSRTWSKLEESGVGITAGAAVAAYALLDCAKAMQGGEEKCRSFMAELKRTAKYVGPTGEDGLGPVPYATAVQHGWISEDEQDEVENLIVFFTLGSRLLPNGRWAIVFRLMTSIRGVEASSLSVTEFASSVLTSKPAASSGTPETAE